MRSEERRVGSDWSSDVCSSDLDGEPQFGIWQGIYLCEHRNNASGRKIFITLIGM